MVDGSEKEQKRVEIVKAAEKLFAHFGLKKTSLDEVAEASGLAKASIYYYFSSKTELFDAVVEYESNILLKKIQKAIDAAHTIDAKLRAYFLARFTHITELVNLRRITRSVARELSPYAEKARLRFFDKEKSILRELLQQGVDEGVFAVANIDFAIMVIIAGTRGLDSALFVYEHRRIEKQDYCDMLDIFFNGILKR